jgi:hypothetical protein
MYRFRAPLAVLALLLTGCSSIGVTRAPEPRVPVVRIPPQTAPTTTAEDGRGAVRPLPPPVGCTGVATDAATAKQLLADAVPGARICVTGDLGDWKMKIGYSGTREAPVHVLGDGRTSVGGIEVEALNVVVDGFNVLNSPSPQITISGDNVTVRNTVALNPKRPGSDNIQINGDDVTISHNTLGEASGDGGKESGGGAQANCIDIVADSPQERSSHRVRIEGNRCRNTALNCLRAFSPVPEGDVHDNPSSDITFTDNYCQTRGDRAVTADNVQNLTITKNVVASPVNHAWALQNHSTGARIDGNTLAPGTAFEAGLDDSSKDGYQGPAPGGAP